MALHLKEETKLNEQRTDTETSKDETNVPENQQSDGKIA